MNQLKKIFVNNDSSLVTVSAGNPISDPQAKWEYGTSEDLINQKFAVKEAEIDEKIDEQDEAISGYDQRINLLQNDMIELGDKAYDASTYSGLGRKLLKKKASGVNTLYQEDINEPNTIYVIQYDYVLGEDITIPSNCVLEFDGGSISGAYTITGTNTKINAYKTIIFNNGVLISGTWNCPQITSLWFGDATSDNRIKQIFALTNPDIYNTVVIEKGEHIVSISENNQSVIRPNSNTDIILLGSIKMTTNSFSHYRIFASDGELHNLTISGGGSLIGDKDEHPETVQILDTETYGRPEFCHAISLKYDNSNLHIKDITVTGFPGDGIDLGGTNVSIEDCVVSNCGRQAMGQLGNTDGFIVKNCVISEVNSYPNTDYYNNYGFGVCFEAHAYHIRNVIVDNIKLHNVGLGLAWNNNGSTTTFLENSKISNIYITGQYVHAIYCTGFENLVIENIKLINTTRRSTPIVLNGKNTKLTNLYVDGLQNYDTSYIEFLEAKDATLENLRINTPGITLTFRSDDGDCVLRDSYIKCYIFGPGKYYKIYNTEIDGSIIATIDCLFEKCNIHSDASYDYLIYTSGSIEIRNSIISGKGGVDITPRSLVRGTKIISYNNDYTALANNNSSNNIYLRFFDCEDIISEHDKFTSTVNIGYGGIFTIMNADRMFSVKGTYANRPLQTYEGRNKVFKGFAYFATDKGVAGVGAMIYYTNDNTTPWVYADGTAVS